MSDPGLYPCFLGPYGENDTLLESLVVEFLRDHVYWRRNLHPEDPPAIPTAARRMPQYMDFEARLRRELHQLSAALKRSVPFHSPRYIGHMVSDLLIPGLAAQFLTLPYNPNNVSTDAAPVTIDLEIKVGLQLAAMLGYPHDPARADCAFGHLTSGGTLANVQGLRLAMALKAFPVALRAIAPPSLDLPDDDLAAFNMHPVAATGLLEQWHNFLAAQSIRDRTRWRGRLDAQRLESMGMAAFFAAHPQLRSPLVFAPSTAHYSWSKGMKLLGLGRRQLQLIPSRSMRLDIPALEQRLETCRKDGQPVLMVVGILGSTEFGTIDPLDQLADLRERQCARGQGFSLHVDAAWGGYLATLFRGEDNALRPLSAVQREFAQFPSPQVYAAIAALPRMDSATVDPHKLGYIPYGAGAFVCREQRAITLLAEGADYVFRNQVEGDYFQRFRQLGQFIPEGSKPGANAAAVYVTHRVMPLNHRHFGRLPAESIRATEAFVDEARAFFARVADRVHCQLPFEPDSNLVCLAINPRGNRSIRAMNSFLRKLHLTMSANPERPLQSGEYFGSITTLKPESLGTEETAMLLQDLGLDDDGLDSGDDDADRLVILRHTLMNPFLLDSENEISYLAGYFEFLQRNVIALLASAAVPGSRCSPNGRVAE